jgi:large subunit ribosomal protein L21
MTSETKKVVKTDKLAIIRTGSKQYVVSEGSIIKIEKLSPNEVKDSKVKFDDVLLVAEGEKVEVGAPIVKASVSGEIIAEGRDKKVTVIHYKAKSRYFKKAGHRQPFMKVKIAKIS